MVVIISLPSRGVSRWGYKIGEGQVRVARGWLFRTDTSVPFVRVQHIDVGQGPGERWFGLSHLIVHTSGTHNGTVTLPGLPADLAAAMRELAADSSLRQRMGSAAHARFIELGDQQRVDEAFIQALPYLATRSR